MNRSPLIDIRAFADDRAKDVDVVTTRLNQLFKPMVGPMPQDGQGGLSMGQPVQVAGPPQAPPQQAPPQQAPQPAPQPFADVADAGAGYTNVQLPDGTVQRREGTRSWRNNNPGNIEYGNFAESQGAVGSDGRFAVFPTYEAGRSAKESLLFESPSYRDRTVSGAINRYAPPSENDTRNYVGQVANAVGVSPDTKLSDLSPQQRSTMLDAMQRVEGFKPGTVNGAQSDDMYRTVGNALGVTTSTSGETTPQERRTIEGDLGAILNETQNPESQVKANKRQGVADLFTGLGIGFGQMSRGDRVDLSEVRDAAAQRRREQTALRMERAKRAAGASYAMELGDEGMARAIAGGAANIGDLLTVRQQNAVERRANAKILREVQSQARLADFLAGSDIGLTDNQISAIGDGVDPETVLSVSEMSRAAETAAEQQQIDDDVAAANLAIAEQVLQSADETGNKQDIAAANLVIANQGGLSFADARTQAEGAFPPVETAKPSAKELQIARIMEANGVNRSTAVNIADGVVEMQNGIPVNMATGKPVTELTAGLSPGQQETAPAPGPPEAAPAPGPPEAAPAPGQQEAAPAPGQQETVPAPGSPEDAAALAATETANPANRETPEESGLPPRGSNGTSLYERIPSATGAWDAIKGVWNSTVAQALPDLTAEERERAQQEFDIIRGTLVRAFKSADGSNARPLAQELDMLLREVAPSSSIFQSSSQLAVKMDVLDRELRQRHAEYRKRAADPGVSFKQREQASNLAASLERAITRLHEPDSRYQQSESTATRSRRRDRDQREDDDESVPPGRFRYNSETGELEAVQ